MNTARLLALILVLVCISPGLLTAEEQSRIGTVLEAKTVGQYVYLKLDEQGEEAWLAAMQFEVSPGDEVEYLGGDAMTDFYSKSLDRTFASIRFVTRIRTVGQEASGAPAKPAMPADEKHRNLAQGKPTAPPLTTADIGSVEGGRTIAEIFADRDKLAGEKVILRGQVVKVNKNILGKNWITLRDGTGAAPDDKLIVTSQMTVQVGEIVTVDGVLRTDVDLGSGYLYKVLLENASFNL